MRNRRNWRTSETVLETVLGRKRCSESTKAVRSAACTLLQLQHAPRAEEGQQLRHASNAHGDRRQAQMAPVPAILFKVPQWLPHRRWNVELLHVGARPFDASVPVEISKHLDAECRMSAPALAWIDGPAVAAGRGINEALRELFGVPVFEPVVLGEGEEMLPDRAVSPERPSAVPKSFQLSKGALYDALQRCAVRKCVVR